MNKARPELDLIEREAVSWVRKLVSDDMTPDDAAALKLWCARSALHQSALARTQRVWSAMGNAGRAVFAADADFRGELDAYGRQRRMTRRAVLGGGVTALAAAGVYGVANPPLGLWPSWFEINADYRTATGEQRQVSFGDVAINLNTQTSLAVRRAEAGEDRVELIAGEASFASPVGAARALVVVAANGQASGDSCRFAIRCRAGGDPAAVEVTCFEGVVRITCGHDTLSLPAGQHVPYGAAGFGAVSVVDLQRASDWQRGIVEFRDTPVVEAVEEINRYRPGRIVVMNATLSHRQLSGRFRIDQMNQVLRQLELAFGAKLHHLPGGVVLLG